MRTLPRIASAIICLCSVSLVLHAQVPQLIIFVSTTRSGMLRLTRITSSDVSTPKTFGAGASLNEISGFKWSLSQPQHDADASLGWLLGSAGTGAVAVDQLQPS
jgi:hypothetical protein